LTTRDLSSALFGNEKMIAVVLAVAAEHDHATAQQVAKRVGVNHDLARKPLLRLVEGGMLVALPREGGRRSPQYYEAAPGPRWEAMKALCRTLYKSRSVQDDLQLSGSLSRQQPASNGDAQRRTSTDGEGVRDEVGERERTCTDVHGLARTCLRHISRPPPSASRRALPTDGL
jgi:hypothetical protein